MELTERNQNEIRLPKRLALPWLVMGGGFTVVTLAALYLPLADVLAVIGQLVCVTLAVVLAHLLNEPETSPPHSLLEIPFWLAHDLEVFDRYRRISQAMLTMSQHPDPIFRPIALEQLDQVAERTTAIAGGTLVFEGTESWRIAYERLLRSPGLHEYRSVAWIKNAEYWQDEPGRKSLAVNFELHDSGRLHIERIAIIADALWPEAALWPDGLVHYWLSQQTVRGMGVKFVRESALQQEPELIADIGIYGTRAVGTQELDAQCRTVRFSLTFDFLQVQLAEERWQRLTVYAESFANYANRYANAS